MWFLKVKSKKVRKTFTVTYVKCDRFGEDNEFVVYENLNN